MKKELMLILILVTVVGAVFWYFGNQAGRALAFESATNSRLTNLESRLLPIEKDYKGREKIRAFFRRIAEKVRGKIGL